MCDRVPFWCRFGRCRSNLLSAWITLLRNVVTTSLVSCCLFLSSTIEDRMISTAHAVLWMRMRNQLTSFQFEMNHKHRMSREGEKFNPIRKIDLDQLNTIEQEIAHRLDQSMPVYSLHVTLILTNILFYRIHLPISFISRLSFPFLFSFHSNEESPCAFRIWIFKLIEGKNIDLSHISSAQTHIHLQQQQKRICQRRK